jgi:copper chaperone
LPAYILLDTLNHCRRCNVRSAVSSKDNQEEEMAEFTLQIDGMHCGSCVRRVTQALDSTEGVHVEEVSIGVARLSAQGDPAPVDLAIAAVAKAGYTAQLAQ